MMHAYSRTHELNDGNVKMVHKGLSRFSREAEPTAPASGCACRLYRTTGRSFSPKSTLLSIDHPPTCWLRSSADQPASKMRILQSH